jgi:phage repressor protein C with HTH and peptisase S24 domain
METSGNRLQQAREAAGFKSARQAALRYGWKPSTYRSHENGQIPEVPATWAKEYAKKFGVSVGWILTGEGRRKSGPRPTEDRHYIAISGYVGAGATVIPFDDSSPIDEFEFPKIPDGMNCVVIRGNSMYPRYFDGEKLLYPSERQSPARLLNEECVVCLTNGQMLVKIIRRGSRKTLFNLESWNAPLMEDQAIEWACPIELRAR